MEYLKKDCSYVIIESAKKTISEKFIKELHKILKSGTSSDRLDWFKVGDYKKLPNEVGGKETTKPKIVAKEIKKLIDWYNSLSLITFDDILDFHYKFELIHPFGDGNGRTIRGFTNKLFEDAGLPPIYIKANERTEYHKAMNLANNENDYTAIKQFYRYKVCDSIIELDINERLKEEEKPKQMKKAK